jgi:hypothetical protein
MYKAKVAVCSEIRTKHSTQSEHQVEFLNVKPLGFKRFYGLLYHCMFCKNYWCQLHGDGEIIAPIRVGIM